MSLPDSTSEIDNHRRWKHKRRIVSLNPNDIVLGRGHIKHLGNRRFRSIVQANSSEYTECINSTEKDAIARRIVREISLVGGRFVRVVVPKNTNNGLIQWEIADEDTILLKVKQTFRDISAAIRREKTDETVAQSTAESMGRRFNNPAPMIQQALDMSESSYQSHLSRGLSTWNDQAELEPTPLPPDIAPCMQRQQEEQEERLHALFARQRAILSSQQEEDRRVNAVVLPLGMAHNTPREPPTPLQDALLGLQLARQFPQQIVNPRLIDQQSSFMAEGDAMHRFVATANLADSNLVPSINQFGTVDFPSMLHGPNNGPYNPNWSQPSHEQAFSGSAGPAYLPNMSNPPYFEIGHINQGLAANSVPSQYLNEGSANYHGDLGLANSHQCEPDVPSPFP